MGMESAESTYQHFVNHIFTKDCGKQAFSESVPIQPLKWR